ncbi:tetratricopeptide repeat protein [Thalassoglobus polymorphus]|uniref:Tetratricopeptide repeat protein n=1 Tax=Thalassoglobus polymorphus TaxID=2527994 RepID=A0A517QSZ1_9PLAN|nr:tetratricopeptide repeat protein [Thalassoglobus polymorphus]QDT34657.1 tetratricopeptide repeat protein [Thalassoglobus polymorphus]
MADEEKKNADSSETSKPAGQETPPNEFKAHRKRTTFNLKLALSLIAGTLVFGVGIHFLHAYQVDRNADSLLNEAKEAQAQSEFQKAAQYYRTYISFRPEDSKAIGDYAELLDGLAQNGNDLQRAYFTYEQALRIDGARDDLRMRIAEIAMTLRRFTDALDHIKVLEKKSQHDSKLSLLAARCYLANGEVPASAKRYLNVLNFDQTNVESYSALADLFLSYPEEIPKRSELEDVQAPKQIVDIFPTRATKNEQGELAYDDRTPAERSTELLEAMVTQGEPKFQAHLERSYFRTRNNQLEQASADVQKALELAKNDPEVLLAAATLEITQAKAAQQADGEDLVNSHLTKATEFAKEGLNLPNPNPNFFMSLYEVEMLRKDLVAAQKEIQNGLDAIEAEKEGANLERRQELTQTELIFQMTFIDLLITQGGQSAPKVAVEKWAEAEESLNDFRTKAGESWVTNYLESRLHVARREWKQAIPKLERVRNLLASTTDSGQKLGHRRLIDLNLGLCYERLNNPDRRIVVFRRALSQDPLWHNARLELARALRAANRHDEAIQTFRLIQGIPGVPLELAQLLLYRESQKPVEQQRWDVVNQAINAELSLRKEKGLPSTAGIEAFRAELSNLQGRREEAEELLAKARLAYPEDPGLVTVQVSIILSNLEVESSKRIEEARRIIDEAEEKFGDSFELRAAKSQIARLMAPLEADGLLTSLQTGLESWDPAEVEQLLQRIASVYTTLGDIEGEKQTWLKLVELDPENLLARVHLLQIANNNNDESLKKNHLPDLIEIEGAGGPIGNVLLAQELVASVKTQEDELTSAQRDKLIQARGLLEQAQLQRAFWPLIPRILGRIEALLGDEEVALEQFRKAFELGDYSLEVVWTIVQDLYKKERYDEAGRLLKEASQKTPQLLTTGPLARLAANVAWQRQQYGQSLELSEAAAESSNDFRDLVLLSRKRAALEESDERVMEPLRTAIKRFETEPQAWLAMVDHLRRNDQIEEAEATLKQAEEKLPDVPQHLTPLTLARGYELIGNVEKSTQYYQAAFDTDPANTFLQYVLADFFSRQGNYDKATPLLSSLSSAESKASPELKEWARSRSARSLASSGNYSDIQKALKLIDDAASPQETSLFNLRTKAEMLASRTTKAHHRERIKILETISERGEINNDERLTLARLYDATDNWEKSRQTFEGLAQSLPNADLLMIEFSHALVRHDELDEAKKWLERARLKSSQTFAILRLDATIQNKTNGIDAAEKSVIEFLDNEDSITTSPQTVQDLLTNRDGQTVLRDFSKTLEAESPDEHAKFVEGTRLLSDGQVAPAIQKFLPFLKRDDLKKEVQAYFHRKASRLFTELKAYDKAETYFRKAMAISERSSDNLELISILSRQNHLNDALDLCDQLWEQGPDTLAAKTSVAVLRTGQPTKNEIKRVEAKITSAVKESATPDQILMHLADLKDLAGEHDQSVALYEQILEKNPQNLVALNNFAYLSTLAGKDKKRALDAINSAIEVVGPIAAMLDTRGVVYLKSGNLDKAIKDLTQAVDENPTVSSQFRLAQAYMEKGDKKKATSLFEAAEEDGLSLKELHPLERKDFEEVEKSLKAGS